MASESVSQLIQRIVEGVERLFLVGPSRFESSWQLFWHRYVEYRRDPLSVSPEWRQLLDDHIELQRLRLRPPLSNFGQIVDPIIKPKDDEAFRFFLDEPDLEN
jgi:hypothetical protein